jgi:hypothetical protein
MDHRGCLAHYPVRRGPDRLPRLLAARGLSPGSIGCVYLPDLDQPRPPDVPPGMVKLRLVKKT